MPELLSYFNTTVCAVVSSVNTYFMFHHERLSQGLCKRQMEKQFCEEEYA